MEGPPTESFDPDAAREYLASTENHLTEMEERRRIARMHDRVVDLWKEYQHLKATQPPEKTEPDET